MLEQGHEVIDFSMVDERNFDSPFSSSFVPNINYKDAGGFLNKIKQAVSFIHSPVAVSNIKHLIEHERPQIAHLHNIYHQLTPSIIPLVKKHGAKAVLTLHDCKLVCPSYLCLNKGHICVQCKGRYFWKPFTTNCQNSLSQGLLLSLEAIYHKWKGCYEGVDLFLAPSQFMADQISMRIPFEKIQVLHNGIDIDKYQVVYSDKGYGLYFGRLSNEKGVSTLLDAHRKLDTKWPLKIVGTGPLEEELRRANPNAEFLGYKTGGELNKIIADAAFVVVPSEWYENCSMVVLESMAFGKPVIASNIGGLPEQVENGSTGILFEMGNIAALAQSMATLSEDKEMRIAMGKAARKKLEREYSLQSHCDTLMKIYNELLN